MTTKRCHADQYATTLHFPHDASFTLVVSSFIITVFNQIRFFKVDSLHFGFELISPDVRSLFFFLPLDFNLVSSEIGITFYFGLELIFFSLFLGLIK